MALVRGKPQLAVWSNTDNRLRLFELSASDVFEALGDWSVTPVTTGGLAEPGGYDNTLHYLQLGFYKDFLWALVRTGAAAGSGNFLTFSRNSQLTSLTTGIIGAPANYIITSLFKDKTKGVLFVNKVSGENWTVPLIRINDEGIATSNNNPQAVGINITHTGLPFTSPDGKFIGLILLNNSYVHWATFTDTYHTDGMPIFNPIGNFAAPNQTPVPYGPQILPCTYAWTPDSKYAVVLQKTLNAEVGYINVLQYDPSQPSPQTQLTIQSLTIANHPVSVAVHPSGRFIAVGIRNIAGSTWRIEIYRRMGKYLQLLSTISGAGKALDFTQDGRFLIDAVSKKAWNFSTSGVAVENTDILANIPTGVVMQSLSDHVDILGTSATYDATLDFSVNENVNALVPKLILLKSTATFDATHTTVSEVTNAGAEIVSNVEFPASGVALVANDLVKTAGKLTIHLQDITIQSKSAITFRKGLIYDETTGLPLTFIDFGKDISPPADTSVKFSMSEYPFTVYYLK